MSLLALDTIQPAGLTSVIPSIIYVNTSDTYATVTATGYLTAQKQQGFTFSNNQMALVYTSDEGPVWLKVVITYSGATVLNTVVSLVAPDVEGGGVPFINTVPVTSATPGTIRSITGAVTETASVMSSGNLVGVRGSVTLVGASGGFLYGCQGKAIVSGILSGSSWTAPVFAQIDWSAGTLNGGQVGVVWADMGATSGTATDVSGLRMFAGTNTTAATANSMIYLYGKTSNLLELDANGSTYISTGGATASGTIKKIAILIEGVQYYLQAATVYS